MGAKRKLTQQREERGWPRASSRAVGGQHWLGLKGRTMEGQEGEEGAKGGAWILQLSSRVNNSATYRGGENQGTHLGLETLWTT